MMYLILSIITNAALVLLLKAFDKWKVNLFHALVFNYVTASLFGFYFAAGNQDISDIPGAPWLWMALLLGVFFISLFYIIGISSQQAGVAATSVANKMSLVIPVAAAVWLYGDSLSVLKVSGIILALGAVYLSSLNEKKIQKSSLKKTLLPFLIFFGSGILDSLINFSQKKFQLENESGFFLATAFSTAAFTGFIILLVKILSGKNIPGLRSASAGVLLGMVNYFSIYFLLLALGSSSLQSSVIFPVNNMGIVALSAIAAFLLFGEKLSRKNVFGIFLSLLALALITRSK